MSERTSPRIDRKIGFTKKGALKVGGALLATTVALGLTTGCTANPNTGPNSTQSENAADRDTRETREKVLDQTAHPEAAVQIIADPLVETPRAKLRYEVEQVIPQTLNPKYEYDVAKYSKELKDIQNKIASVPDARVKNEATAHFDAQLAEGVVGSVNDYYTTYEGGNNADSNAKLVTARRKQAEFIGNDTTKETALKLLDITVAQNVAGVKKATEDSEALKGLIVSDEYRTVAEKAAGGDAKALSDLQKAAKSLEEQLAKLTTGSNDLSNGSAIWARIVNESLEQYQKARAAIPGERVPAYKDIALGLVNNINGLTTTKFAKEMQPLIPNAQVQEQMKKAIDDKILYTIDILRVSTSASDMTKQVNDTVAMIGEMSSPEAKKIAGAVLAQRLAEAYTAPYYGQDADKYAQALLDLFDTLPEGSEGYKALALKVKGGADKSELTQKGSELKTATARLRSDSSSLQLIDGSNRQARSVNQWAKDYLDLQ